MRITICELPDSSAAFASAFKDLAHHVQTEGSELVILPEMPFAPWLFATPTFDSGLWRAARDAHAEASSTMLHRLGSAAVVATRPADRSGGRVNEAFVLDVRGERALHQKRYLPNEDGAWEASWYGAGDGQFGLGLVATAKVGVLVCSELWFPERARAYGRAGAHLILCPRATEARSVEGWIVGGRAAAIVAGTYCVSSNRRGATPGGVEFGGAGFAAGPDGELLAVTSVDRPFVTIEADLAVAERAKRTYPRTLDL